ncbi:MAG: RagB/SusD family nutrient uptake outer membrane protein, partial [Bacteroidota bacterium]
RVGQVPHAGYQADQESFRDAVMDEYRFELIGEGEDSFHNRRRGYDYFLRNTILRRNNGPDFDPNLDVLLNTEESQVMFLPIPLLEINTNQLITD